jgi:hypothetical protein
MYQAWEQAEPLIFALYLPERGVLYDLFSFSILSYDPSLDDFIGFLYLFYHIFM